jgi:hypothetical protein
VGALISKLQEQYQQQADVAKIAFTAQMLIAELQKHQPANSPLKNVSVSMPRVNTEACVSLDSETMKKNDAIVTSQIQSSQIFKKEKSEKQVTEKNGTSSAKKDYSGWLFDPVQEVPTLAHQNKAMQEWNEVIAVNEESLNEKLRVERIELGAKLKDAPIRDLKKAIGINDRYLFINELFRGDETMYERSIKTINSFSILPEAEYWIQRELKLKVGWNEDSEAVQHFDQLVRRRFS